MSDDKAVDHSDEMEAKLSELDDHIDDAEKKLSDRRADADNRGGNVTGEFHNEQDRHGGDDAVGAATDAEHRGEDGAQAPKGAVGTEGDSTAGGPASGASDDPDEMVAEEQQGPT